MCSAGTHSLTLGFYSHSPVLLTRTFILFFKKLLYFLKFCVCWVFIVVRTGFSPVWEIGGYSLVAVYRLLIAVVSLAAEHRL